MTNERDTHLCLKHHKQEAKGRNRRFYFILMWLPAPAAASERGAGEAVGVGGGQPRGMAALGRDRISNFHFSISARVEPPWNIWSLHIRWKVEKKGRTNLIVLCEVTLPKRVYLAEPKEKRPSHCQDPP